MNKVFLTGNLTRSPEEVKTAKVPMCKFGIAVRNPYSKDDKPTFFNVLAFGKQAGLCLQYLHKGNKVNVCGSISLDTYTGQDGTQRSNLVVNMSDIDFLTPKSESEPARSPTPPTPKFTEVDEDELPF